MIVLSDSGILLRLFEPNDPLHAIVFQAVRVLDARGDSHTTAPQNVAEFWNVCTRPRSARGGFGLSFPETERRLTRLERKYSILVDKKSTYRTWRGLVTAHRVQGKQVHDARLAALMLTHGITHILTLNAADFRRHPGITVIDPASLAPPP